MKGAILREIPRGYFTNMKDIFEAIRNEQSNYNWLITDYECNYYPAKEISETADYIWIDGIKLSEIINKYDIQFIWGGFSGFRKSVLLEDILKYNLPFAGGNKDLWNSDVKMQHPLAEIEIISWDSSLVVIISKLDNIINSFFDFYPHAIDLKEFNLR